MDHDQGGHKQFCAPSKLPQTNLYFFGWVVMKWKLLTIGVGCLCLYLSLMNGNPILFNLYWVDGAMSNELMEMIVASLVNYGNVSETNHSLEVHMFWSLWNHDFLSFKNWLDDLVHAKTCSPFQRCALHNTPCKSGDYHFEFQRLLSKVTTFNFPC